MSGIMLYEGYSLADMWRAGVILRSKDAGPDRDVTEFEIGKSQYTAP